MYKVDGTHPVNPFDIIRAFKFLYFVELNGDIKNFVLSARIMVDGTASGDRGGPSTFVLILDVDPGRHFGHLLLQGFLDRRGCLRIWASSRRVERCPTCAPFMTRGGLELSVGTATRNVLARMQMQILVGR